MSEHDILQRFLFEESNIRGVIVRLRASYQAVSDRHPYPNLIKELVGEALTAVALLSSTIKFEGLLTLQTQGDGPVSLLVAQSNEQFHLRGLAKWEGEITSLEQALGEGNLAITITPKQGERYQGVVKITSRSLAKTIEDYFQQSEQIPTCLMLSADENIAAGFLLQKMPDSMSLTQQDFWDHIVHLTRTLKATELLNLPNQEILHRLYHEENVRLFDAEPVSFRCSCTVERMENAIRLFGYQEALDILKTHKQVVVSCEFCNRHYSFDKVDIERIFAGGGHVPPASVQ